MPKTLIGTMYARDLARELEEEGHPCTLTYCETKRPHTLAVLAYAADRKFGGYCGELCWIETDLPAEETERRFKEMKKKYEDEFPEMTEEERKEIDEMLASDERLARIEEEEGGNPEGEGYTVNITIPENL